MVWLLHLTMLLRTLGWFVTHFSLLSFSAQSIFRQNQKASTDQSVFWTASSRLFKATITSRCWWCEPTHFKHSISQSSHPTCVKKVIVNLVAGRAKTSGNNVKPEPYRISFIWVAMATSGPATNSAGILSVSGLDNLPSAQLKANTSMKHEILRGSSEQTPEIPWRKKITLVTNEIISRWCLQHRKLQTT